MVAYERTVGVMICAFNARKTIQRAVFSALAQDHVAEVIVVNDASQDDTADLAATQDDGTGRLCVINLPQNRGPAAARNVAIARSKSRLLCVLDADDYFLPGRVNRLLHAGSGEWDILADDILIVPEHLHDAGFLPAENSLPSSNRLLDLTSFLRASITDARVPRSELAFLKPIIRRRFLDVHNLRYDESMRFGEDYAFYAQALIAGAKFRLVGACGYVAIERHDSLSSRHSAEDHHRLAEFDRKCLEQCPTLSQAERAALFAHFESTIRKRDYRRALDYKKTRGIVAAMALMARSPRSIGYAVSETLRAKAPKYWRSEEPQTRFLIGGRM